jgi:hypothetical protein
LFVIRNKYTSELVCYRDDGYLSYKKLPYSVYKDFKDFFFLILKRFSRYSGCLKKYCRCVVFLLDNKISNDKI